MTLFLKVTRDYIQQQISYTNTQSSNEDDGIMGLTRDGVLSNAKQATTSSMSRDIERIDESYGSDEQVKIHIDRIVEEFRRKISDDIDEYDGPNSGKSNKLISKLKDATQSVYQNCQQLGLLDTPYDPTSPVHIVQCVILKYLADRYELKDKIREKKKQACMQCLKNLQRNVRSLSHEEAMPAVREAITTLSHENQRLCEQHATKWNLPGGFYIPISIPGRRTRKPGFLEKAVLSATRQLNQLRFDAPVPVELEEEEEEPDKKLSSTASTLGILSPHHRNEHSDDDDEDDEHKEGEGLALTTAAPTKKTGEMEQVFTDLDFEFLLRDSTHSQEQDGQEEDNESEDESPKEGVTTVAENSGAHERDAGAVTESSQNPFDNF